MPDFLPIADFAEKVGMTKQAIYKRLPKDLAPFLSIQDKKKMIATEALSLFAGESKEDNQSNDTIEKESALQAHLEAVTEMLKSEQAKNAELQKELIKLSASMVDITQRSQTIADQAQQLHVIASAERLEMPIQGDVPSSQPPEPPPPRKNRWTLFGRRK